MSKNLSYLGAGIATLLFSAGPALAESIPEPATMSMMGAGVVAAIAIARFCRRK